MTTETHDTLFNRLLLAQHAVRMNAWLDARRAHALAFRLTDAIEAQRPLARAMPSVPAAPASRRLVSELVDDVLEFCAPVGRGRRAADDEESYDLPAAAAGSHWQQMIDVTLVDTRQPSLA